MFSVWKRRAKRSFQLSLQIMPPSPVVRLLDGNGISLFNLPFGKLVHPCTIGPFRRREVLVEIQNLHGRLGLLAEHGKIDVNDFPGQQAFV